MNNPNDTEMPDAHDSSGFLDDTHSEVNSTPGRPKGSTLRPRRLTDIDESPHDYADLFRALQIRPESHERFLNGVLKVVRQKNIKDLQSGTDAKIRQLSRMVVRGYRTIIWTEESRWLLESREMGAKWLLDPEELEEGEERLLHGGDNERFYPLLEPIWWRMRDIVFEPKPPPKGRVGRKKPNLKDGSIESAYEADNDTELDTRPPHDRARDQTLRKITKLITDVPQTSQRYMSVDETDAAIVDLVVQLADTRARSEPNTFQRLWDQHIGRIDELENSHSHHDSSQTEPTTQQTPVNTTTAAAAVVVTIPPNPSNLSNEPFATLGNPIPQPWPSKIPAQIPAAMAVYISNAPPESPYMWQAYEWLNAPVRMVDQTAFYKGLMLRVKMEAAQVKGLVMSYGWCDVCRWIAGGSAGEREGWSVLQSDLAWAAGRGIRVWRMKVLVVGS